MPIWVISITIQAGEKGGVMKIIEHTPSYELLEVNEKSGPEVEVRCADRLTPQQAYALGKQLINWAASVDPELVAIG